VLTVGSLFSGIGGFDLGLERAGMRVIWQVENNGFCRSVLRQRFPGVPCYDDIKAIDWDLFTETPDLICGGFPCQPFSQAGKRRGTADDRYLWPEVVRCLDTLRPAWFLGENVPGLINMALDTVCTDLESLGYAVWPVCLPACAVDAPHRRDRLWIVAYARRQGQSCRGLRSGEASTGEIRHGGLADSGEIVADDAFWSRGDGSTEDEGNGGEGGRSTRPAGRRSSANANAHGEPVGRTAESWQEHCEWESEPNVGRVAHGVPQRVDRLRALGNAIVPHLAEILGRMILKVHS
jgi:DNA (cytosine-5)-methyltransferase 1